MKDKDIVLISRAWNFAAQRWSPAAVIRWCEDQRTSA